MDNHKYDAILVIDEELASPISLEEAQALKPIQAKFLESYLEKGANTSVDEWLRAEMAENLPEHSADEVTQMSDEIISTLKTQEGKKASLEKAIANGRSKESWFASEMKASTAAMTAQETAKYLQGLDNALDSANDALYRTLHTKAGAISQNAYLDGYIAEQYHAQTFNLNAAATGSPYRAKVLEPKGTGYAKNSVDIVIVDQSGKVVRRYQSKYCKTPTKTALAFKQGDYRGQQKLVPEGYSKKLEETTELKKTTEVIKAPDGTTSNPLSKPGAKELQKEAQSGKWNELNWNDYKTRDLAIGIGKQAGQAAVMGIATGVGFDIAQKVWNGENIDGQELVETAITSGMDHGVKAAAAGALKVGVERGFVPSIPKGTSAGTITNIAHVAVENVKIIDKMATGELTVKEGIEKMEQTTVSTVAGIAAQAKGAAIGKAIGSVFGPVGAAVGGFIGGTVGYMAGSKVGQSVVKGVQKIREKASNVVQSVGRAVSNTVSAVASGIRSVCSGVLSIFGW